MVRSIFRPIVAVVVAASLCGLLLVGCGGGGSGEQADTLTVGQRLLPPAESPGFTVRKNHFVWSDARSVVDEGIGPALPAGNTKEATNVLEQANFVSGAAEVLSAPGSNENLIVIVLQLGSPVAAEMTQRWLHDQDLKPCSGNCGVQIERIDVGGVPGALAVRRVINPAAAGPNSPPYDRYVVEFTDGSFLYSVERASPSRTPSEDEADEMREAAKTEYERVHSVPLP